MQFETYLREQIALHPSAEPQDVVKLCYQAAFGAEHLMADRDRAEKYFLEEYDRVRPMEEPLYERIGDDVLRVNLGAWKRRGLPWKWLFQMFAETAANPPKDGEDGFASYIREANRLVSEGLYPFDRTAWEAFWKEYPSDRPIPVHHSEGYRQAESPAYRLVCGRFLRLFPLLSAVWEKGLRGNSPDSPAPDRCVVAIDGRCASGKTTLADQLARVTGAGVVHMDDFFLPAELRTKERLLEPGGNVHYERFLEEVLPAVKRGGDFSYRRFDCAKMALGEERKVPGSEIVVVEGAYSYHPKFGPYMTIRAFGDVEPEEQLRRVAVRDGEAALEDFRQRWIPLEETYFAAYQIRERADVVL